MTATLQEQIVDELKLRYSGPQFSDHRVACSEIRGLPTSCLAYVTVKSPCEVYSLMIEHAPTLAALLAAVRAIPLPAPVGRGEEVQQVIERAKQIFPCDKMLMLCWVESIEGMPVGAWRLCFNENNEGRRHTIFAVTLPEMLTKLASHAAPAQEKP